MATSLFGFEISVEKALEKLNNAKVKTARDRDKILNKWITFIIQKTKETFHRLEHGGTYRGVTWEYYKTPWYTRSDGTEVPPWGGVPYANGKGKVKGRLQRSGKKLSNRSKLLRDTDFMYQEAKSRSNFVIERATSATIDIDDLVPYAVYQQELRPFLFFTSEDLEEFRRIVLDTYKDIRESDG